MKLEVGGINFGTRCAWADLRMIDVPDQNGKLVAETLTKEVLTTLSSTPDLGTLGYDITPRGNWVIGPSLGIFSYNPNFPGDAMQYKHILDVVFEQSRYAENPSPEFSPTDRLDCFYQVRFPYSSPLNPFGDQRAGFIGSELTQDLLLETLAERDDLLEKVLFSSDFYKRFKGSFVDDRNFPSSDLLTQISIPDEFRLRTHPGRMLSVVQQVNGESDPRVYYGHFGSVSQDGLNLRYESLNQYLFPSREILAIFGKGLEPIYAKLPGRSSYGNQFSNLQFSWPPQ